MRPHPSCGLCAYRTASKAASSAAIILGKAMGENRLDEARVYATRFCYLSVITALAGGAVILACRPLVLKFMYLYVTVTDVVRSELSTMHSTSSRQEMTTCRASALA